MDRCRLLSPVLFALITVPSLATGEEPGPLPPSRTVEQGLAASYNRLGVQYLLGVRWTRPLSRSLHPLLTDAHVSAGVTHTLTPSYTRVAGWVEMAPLSVLEVRAGVEPGLYFGSFGSLLSFEGYDSDFGDRIRDTRASEARAGTGARIFLAPTAKARLGPLAILSTLTVEWWRSSAAGPLFYEPARDTLLRASGDRLLTASTVLVHQVSRRGGERLSYGLGHELSEVLDAPANRSQRLGVVFAYHFAGRRFGLPAPSVGGRVAYCLDDPLRQGQLTAAFGISIER